MSNNIEALQLKRDFIFRQIEDYKHSLAETDKELAALKAESEKPREWDVFLHKDGKLSYDREVHQDYFMLIGKPITVIEKKPIVITQEITYHFNSECQRLGTYSDQEILVSALKSIGIEARASDD